MMIGSVFGSLSSSYQVWERRRFGEYCFPSYFVLLDLSCLMFPITHVFVNLKRPSDFYLFLFISVLIALSLESCLFCWENYYFMDLCSNSQTWESIQVSRNSEASNQTAFLAVYNMETTDMLGFYQVH